MKRSVKILSFIFAFVILLGAIPFATFAATSATSNPIETSYVTDDLRAMGYNLGNYPKDTSADFVSVINFLEHGYSAKGDQRYYGLYLYLYSPTGKALDMDECRLQMAYKNKDGLTNYQKYYLTVSSVSLDSYSNLFYKLKVEGTTKLVRDINKGFRHYSLSGIELKFQGESIEDFPLEQSWTYTGYMENFGAGENDPGTLYCTKDEVEVIQTELQSASWFSQSSDFGADYRYELSSVYFNIPTYFIKKYGNLDDKPSNGGTSGLYSVRGEYYKYATNGLVVPNDSWKTKFENVVGDNISIKAAYDHELEYISGYPGFYRYLYVTEGSWANKITYWDLSYNTELVYKNRYNYTVSNFVQTKFLNLLVSSSAFVDSVDFKEVYQEDYNKKFINTNGLRLNGILEGVGQHVPYYITVDDESLNSAIKSYASRKEGGALNFLDRIFNGKLYVDDEGYPEIKPIVEVTNSDLSGKGDNTVAENLFMMENDAKRLREFYNDKKDENHIYLMRFEVNPYYCPQVTLHNVTVDDEIGTGYYFEKAVFEEFDILEFTFKNVEGKLTTVPVSCDPIDIVGSIIPGNNQTYPNPNGNDDTTDDELGWWEIVLLVITIILFIVGIILLVWILSKILGFFAPAVEFAERREDRKLDKRRRKLEDARLEMEEKKLREEHEWKRQDRMDKSMKDFKVDEKKSTKKSYESPRAKVQSEDEYFEEELKKYDKRHKEAKK